MNDDLTCYYRPSTGQVQVKYRSSHNQSISLRLSFGISVAATEIPDSNLLWFSDDKTRTARGKNGIIVLLKAGLGIAVVIALLLGYSLFSRPMTLSQLYPIIKIDQCAEIKGYYGIGAQVNDTEFGFDRSDEDFWKLLMLFNEQEYRRSLKDLLPRTTKTHRAEGNNDFWWDVSLRFDEFTMPDGSISSGFLRFHNWYGDLEIYFDGEAYACFTRESKLYDSVFELLSGND